MDRETLSKFHHFSLDVLKCLDNIYGVELENVVESLRSPGRRYHVRVNTLRASPKQVLDRMSHGGFQVEEDEDIPEALWIPVNSASEVPTLSRRVVVDKFTAESVLQGAHVYAPGVVGCSKLRRGDEVNVVDDEGQVLAAGIARMSETEVLTYRKGLAVEITHQKYQIPSIRESKEFKQGLIYPQSLPAIVVSRVLAPKAGETIVDLNCAPGGKLSHICQLMENKGVVIGVDRNESKIKRTYETLRRLRCKNVTLMQHDARYIHLDFPNLRADRCLVDPSCSALGIMPKTYEYCTISEIRDLANYQRQFLGTAASILKPGGRLVYSVCTLTLEECEQTAEYCAEECGLDIEKQVPFVGSPGIAGVSSHSHLFQRFHPHIHGSGYFIASFRKRSNA